MEDLHHRGLLDETLVVVMGEFGRTPKLGQVTSGAGAAKNNGRDHWPYCYTVLFAGGGHAGRRGVRLVRQDRGLPEREPRHARGHRRDDLRAPSASTSTWNSTTARTSRTRSAPASRSGRCWGRDTDRSTRGLALCHSCCFLFSSVLLPFDPEKFFGLGAESAKVDAQRFLAVLVRIHPCQRPCRTIGEPLPCCPFASGLMARTKVFMASRRPSNSRMDCSRAAMASFQLPAR